MHHISFDTTRRLIELHHQELLHEAELRRIVRRLRSVAAQRRPMIPATEPPGTPALAPVFAADRPPQQAPAAVATIGDGGRCATAHHPDAA